VSSRNFVSLIFLFYFSTPVHQHRMNTKLILLFCVVVWLCSMVHATTHDVPSHKSKFTKPIINHKFSTNKQATQGLKYSESLNQYLAQREQLIAEEKSIYFNASVVLNAKEQQANEILLDLRSQDVQKYQADFPPSLNFRDAKPMIDQSPLFKVLKRMPKGGILHIHMIGGAEFLFYNGTYRDNCYINLGAASSQYSKYSYLFTSDGQAPSNEYGAVWQNVMQLRSQAADVKSFDEELFKTLQFYTPPPEVTENEMWTYFDQTIWRLGSLQVYYPVWKASIMDGFQALVDDGVQHVELRGIGGVYTDDSDIEGADMINLWMQTLDEFNAQSDRKLSMLQIWAEGRNKNASTVYEDLQDCVNIRREYGDWVVGYDLVDEEDRYNSLYYYLNDFFNISLYIEENGDLPLPYFFHAGESSWNSETGEASYNLYDAILLNTTRIGHGFALKDFPLLMKMVKERPIPIEICPISNQMLRYLEDIRDHPAVAFLNSGLQITISPDDPGIYGYQGVSYDYYELFMSWGLDLTGLKVLSQNGIKYSALPESSKQSMLKEWQLMWDEWIDFVVSSQ